MTFQERRNEIAKILLVEGRCKVGELAKRFSVTTETIRKDLIVLEQDGIVKKNNGSAEVLNEYYENNYSLKSQKNVLEKTAIAVCATEYIPKGATVFLDSGSTTYQLAKQLRLRKDITVVTNFIPIADMMHGCGIKVVLIGGEMRAVSGAATGPIALYGIEMINADVCFIGTSGCGNADGPCVESFPEAEIKNAMMKNSKAKYLVADSSKFQYVAMVKFANWEDLDLLIVDQNLERKTREKLQDKIKIKIVDAGQSLVKG